MVCADWRQALKAKRSDWLLRAATCMQHLRCQKSQPSARVVLTTRFLQRNGCYALVVWTSLFSENCWLCSRVEDAVFNCVSCSLLLAIKTWTLRTVIRWFETMEDVCYCLSLAEGIVVLQALAKRQSRDSMMIFCWHFLTKHSTDCDSQPLASIWESSELSVWSL